MEIEAQADQKIFGDSSSSSKLILYSFWQSSCSWRVRFALNLKGLSYEYRAVNLARGEQLSPDFERLNPLKYVPVLVDGPVVVSDSYAILLVGIKRREMTLFESVMKNNQLLNWLRKCLFRRFWILTDLNLLLISLLFSCLFLEEKYPQKALLPADLRFRSLNLQVASIVSSSIQPLLMLGLLKTIEENFGPEEKLSWAQTNIEKGFNALEKLLKDFSGRYALGDEVYMADVFLAPQVSIAFERFNIDTIIHHSSEVENSKFYRKFPLLILLQSKFTTLARMYESYKSLPEFQASSPERQPDALN